MVLPPIVNVGDAEGGGGVDGAFEGDGDQVSCARAMGVHGGEEVVETWNVAEWLDTDGVILLKNTNPGGCALVTRLSPRNG